MGVCTSKGPTESDSGPKQGTEKRTQQLQKLNNPAGQQNGTTSPESTTQVKEEPQKVTGQNSNPTKAKPAGSQAGRDDLVQTNNKDVKILLLGSGESGKSTIVKQMKILHKDGFSETEALDYRPFVYKNILECIKNIINAIQEFSPGLVKNKQTDEASVQDFDAQTPILDNDDLKAVLDYDLAVNSDEPFSEDIASKIDSIYSAPEVKQFIKLNQGKFYLIDSSDYFLSAIKRIAVPGYIPTEADILRTRKKTSGIFDFKFQMGGSNVHMFDVGGQRSERKKWIHCFDNVTLIIFCVALSEYDQVLLEENTQNRLEESLALFDSVVNSRWFARTSVVLFLNKIDVFADKLPYSPIEAHFPDYNGGDNLNNAVKYILWRFTQVNRSGLNIYPHVTQATDTSNIQLVFAALKETILENTLRDSGIL